MRHAEGAKGQLSEDRFGPDGVEEHLQRRHRAERFTLWQEKIMAYRPCRVRSRPGEVFQSRGFLEAEMGQSVLPSQSSVQFSLDRTAPAIPNERLQDDAV